MRRPTCKAGEDIAETNHGELLEPASSSVFIGEWKREEILERELRTAVRVGPVIRSWPWWRGRSRTLSAALTRVGDRIESISIRLVDPARFAGPGRCESVLDDARDVLSSARLLRRSSLVRNDLRLADVLRGCGSTTAWTRTKRATLPAGDTSERATCRGLARF